LLRPILQLEIVKSSWFPFDILTSLDLGLSCAYVPSQNPSPPYVSPFPALHSTSSISLSALTHLYETLWISGPDWLILDSWSRLQNYKRFPYISG
jgi:hypothetical protein